MKKSIVRTISQNRIYTVDSLTGDVINEESESKIYVANAKEQFFIGYLTLSEIVANLSGPAIKTYFFLLTKYHPGTLIAINKGIKTEIKKFIKSKSIGTVSNSISDLCKANLLINVIEEGNYYINPRYVFKGNQAERNKSLVHITQLGYAV